MLLFKIGGELTEACGLGMPGPYGELKEIGRQRDRNPSGAAAPPPFDKGGRGAVCNIIELKLGATTDTLHENAGRFLLRISRNRRPCPCIIAQLAL